MKVNIFADIHLYAPKALDYSVAEIINDDELMEGTTFLLGDIVDIKNTLKAELSEAQKAVARLRTYFAKRYLLGNHEYEVMWGNSQWKNYQQTFHINGTPDSPRAKKVLLLHGEVLFWDIEEVLRRRNKTPKGISKWKWSMMSIVNYLDENFYRKRFKVSTEQLDKIVGYMQDHDVIIMGHKHPPETYDLTYKGKRIIICKRGLTRLEV